MAGNNEIAGKMEDRTAMIAIDGPDVIDSMSDLQRPTTDRCIEQQHPGGPGSERTSTDPSTCAPTQPRLPSVEATSARSKDDIKSDKPRAVSIDDDGLSEATGRMPSLRRPDEEAANDVGSSTKQGSTKALGEEQSKRMVIEMPLDSDQRQRTTDGIETSQVAEDINIRAAHDVLVAAAGCDLPYMSSNQKPSVGQTVILFDPSKDLISRGSLTDCMFLENATALSNASAANILLIRNIHRVNTHPLDCVPGGATIVCANDATCSQLALLSNTNVGCQFELGSVDLCGMQTSSDALQSPISRKSDRLRAKPVGWKAWKSRGSEEWIDAQDGRSYNRKRKASSRLSSGQEDEDIDRKSTNLEDMIIGSQSVDPDKTCVRTEGNGDFAKSELASQMHLAPAAAAAAVAASSSLKIYTCKTCNKDFTTEKYLSMHMSLHSGNSYASNALLQSTAGSGGIGGGSGTADLPIRRTKATSPGSMSQWTCKICEKTFAQNSNYKNHIRTHSNERPFVCEICSIGFKERYHLKKHVLFKHTTQLNEKCRFCEKCFKDSTAVRAHERTHSDQRPYACTRCEKTFKTSECLWHHENRSKTCGKSLGDLPFQASLPNAGSGQKPRRGRQTQPSCTPSKPLQQLPLDALLPPVVVPPNFQLMVSAEQVQPIEKSTEVSAVSQSGTVASWNVTSGIRSDGSSRAVKGERGIGERVAAVGSVPISREGVGVDGEGPIPAVKVEMEMNIFDYDLTGIATSDSSLEEYCVDLEEREAEEDEYDDEDDAASVVAPNRTKCDEMSAAFYQKQQSLVMHQQQQQQPHLSSRGRLDCGRCGKQCSTQSAYEKHCIVHSEARPHRCDECDIGFKLKVHLKKHNLYRHSNEYPCECKICGKRFKDSSAVRLHERIHSTERPFKCHCGKGFKTRENLWGHRHRGPCDKSDDFLLQNPRVFNSDIGPIWGVPLNLMNAHTMADDDIRPQEFSLPTVPHHHFLHQQQQQVYPKDVLTSLAGVSCSATPTNQRQALTITSQLFKRDMSTGPTSRELPSFSSSSSASCSSSSIAKFAVSGSRAIALACSASTTAAGVPYPPTAVVVPIKREVVDVSKAEGSQGVAVVSEKCSLPPFETLVTTHRPSPLTSLVDSGGSEGAAAAVHVPGSFTQPSIADRCPTVQKILLMNGPPGNVRVRLPGIQQLFQTHSIPAAETLSAAAAAVTEATDDDVRSRPADLSYQNPFGVAMSSPSPVSTSSPTVLNGTDFVCKKMLHQVHKQQQQQQQQQQSVIAQTPAGLIYLHGAEFCLPPPPPYPGLTSFSSAVGVSVSATKSSEAEMLTTQSSSCGSVVYWAGERGQEAFVSADGDRKISSALSWPASSSSSTSEPESLLLGDCSISSRFDCF